MIKKKNVILDSQIITTLQGCDRKADFRFNHSLVPIRGKSKSLEKGSLVHEFLEAFYRSLKDGVSRSIAESNGHIAGEAFIKEMKNTPIEEAMDALEVCHKYLKHRRNDSWKVIDVECGRGEVVYEDDEIRVLYKVKYDLIVDTSQEMFPVDHKSMSRNGETLDLNNQFMGQCLLMKTRKMMINKIGFQKSLKPDEQFVRVFMNYSADRLAEFVELIGYYAKVMINNTETGYWPPRFTSCDKFFGCEYKHVCQGDRLDRNRLLKEQFVVSEPWDVEID